MAKADFQIYRAFGGDNAQIIGSQILVFSISHNNKRVKIYLTLPLSVQSDYISPVLRPCLEHPLPEQKHRFTVCASCISRFLSRGQTAGYCTSAGTTHNFHIFGRQY